jgi:hypothetical protein
MNANDVSRVIERPVIGGTSNLRPPPNLRIARVCRRNQFVGRHSVTSASEFLKEVDPQPPAPGQ